MARILVFTETPWRTALGWLDGRTVVTPTPRVSGVLGVEHRSLHSLKAVEIATGKQLAAALRHALRVHAVPGARRDLLRLVGELTALGRSDRQVALRDRPSLEGLLNEFGTHLASLGVQHPDAPPEPGLSDCLLVHGYAYLSERELDLIDACALDGSVIVLPVGNAGFLASSEVAERFLRGRGWQVQRDTGEPQVVGEALAARFTSRRAQREEGVTALVTQDIHDEARHAVRSAHEHLAAGDNVLIVVPDIKAYAPALDAWAWEYGVSLDLVVPMTLGETRLGAWLSDLFEVLRGDWTTGRVLGVLGHPLAGDFPAALRRAAMRRRPAGRDAWARFGLPRVLADWPLEASLHEYAGQLYAHLAAMDEETLSDTDLGAGATLVDLLAELPSLEALPLSDFAALALQTLQEPFQPEPSEGVPVRTPSEIEGENFDHVLVLGLSEGLLPAPVSDPPILDFIARRELRGRGIPVRVAADDVHERERHFWAVLGAARCTLTLSYPSRWGKHAQLPSSYFDALALTPRVPGTAAPLSLEERLAAELGAGQGHSALHRQVRRAVEADLNRRVGAAGPFTGATNQPLALEDHVFSATQLTRLGQCTYRWYAQHVLGLEEPERSDAELLSHERGRLYHRVLELVALEGKEKADPQQIMLERLPQAFEQAVREQGLARRSAWSRQAGEHLERLSRAVQDPTFLPEGRQITAVELPFDQQWQGLRIVGKIDRVDRTVEGEVVVTDYKSGSSRPKGAKDDHGQAKRDVQLPLYLEMAAQFHPDARQVSGHYLSLARREKRILGTAAFREGALTDLVASVNGMASAGHYPADPDVDGHACRHCPYPMLCRLTAATGEGAEQ